VRTVVDRVVARMFEVLAGEDVGYLGGAPTPAARESGEP
jgi:hypothetical protein